MAKKEEQKGVIHIAQITSTINGDLDIVAKELTNRLTQGAARGNQAGEFSNELRKMIYMRGGWVFGPNYVGDIW